MVYLSTFIYHNKYMAIPYFLSFNNLPLNMLYFKSVAILMHDITNHLPPQNTLRLFNTTDQVHAYDTRSSSRGDYEIKFSGLDIKQHKSFSTLGAKIWNCIPPSIINLSKQNFKKKIHNCLPQILSQTNDYPDLPTLLGQMQPITIIGQGGSLPITPLIYLNFNKSYF